MTAKEITVGGEYAMKVSGKVVRVRVMNIRETFGYLGRSRTIYECRNTVTGRDCKAHSPSKFRRPLNGTAHAAAGHEVLVDGRNPIVWEGN